MTACPQRRDTGEDMRLDAPGEERKERLNTRHRLAELCGRVGGRQDQGPSYPEGFCFPYIRERRTACETHLQTNCSRQGQVWTDENVLHDRGSKNLQGITTVFLNYDGTDRHTINCYSWNMKFL